MLIRVIDLETTGFTPPAAGVCEVAYTDLIACGADLAGALADWSVRDAFTAWLTHPGHPIPPETSAIHHIVDEDVAKAASFAMTVSKLFESDGQVIVAFAAHNAKFERQWIDDAITDGIPFVCTYKCAMRLWPDAPGHSNQALRYWLAPDGLDRAVADRAHRAGPDAYVTAFLLREMLKVATLDQLIEWSNKPVLQTKCFIGQNRGKRWSEVDFSFLTWVAARDFGEDVLFTVETEIRRRREAERAAADARRAVAQ